MIQNTFKINFFKCLLFVKHAQTFSYLVLNYIKFIFFPLAYLILYAHCLVHIKFHSTFRCTK